MNALVVPISRPPVATKPGEVLIKGRVGKFIEQLMTSVADLAPMA